MRRYAFAAFVAYQVAGLGAAAVIVARQPGAVLLGAVAVGLPFLALRLLWRHVVARLRIARRLRWS